MNHPYNPKERSLIKGALRRVFSRSDLRRSVIEASRIPWVDIDRPRVTKWSRCEECKQPIPTYLMQVDHVVPLIGVYEELGDLTWDELISRLWCEPSNLRVLCKPCHLKKTKAENAERRRIKKEKKSA